MNRHRRAAALFALASAPLILAGCGDGEIVDAIESALPTAGITAQPTLDPGGGTSTETDAGADTGAEQAAATPEQPPPAPTETPVETAPTEGAAAEDGGLPLWAWVLIILAVIGLVWWLIAASRRRGSIDERDLAAQAEGQLSWVRSQVDDPLVRWRADQLNRPADQRDADSEQARRWALIDQRITAATNDLLTLESGSKDAAVQQAAGMLRQAADGYRNSLDALASSVAAGDQTRITQATQGFAADSSLLDQGRQRLRQAAKL